MSSGMDLENLISRAKWQEEDIEDDIKDNWDDDDPVPPPPPVNVAKKSNKKVADSSTTSSTAQILDPREKRLAEEKLQKESDLKLAKQMLGLEDKDISLEFPLDNKEDFDRFHINLVHKLRCYDKSPHYYTLLERVFRDLCAPLEADELKNLSSAINALFNEKVRVQKAAKQKKKGVKGLAIKVERNDQDSYHDELDDIM